MTTRAADLWFSDGSIVLQAGNTQFRVFHSILAVRSPIFRDMLAIPQPPEAEFVDGCPLVHLPDDEADTTAFLNAVYHPNSFPSYPNDTTLNTIIGCLNLAHKYEVDDLRRRALVHLSSGFPTTLKGLAALTRKRPGGPAILQTERCSWRDSIHKVDILLRVIRVAYTTGALWILPVCYLRLTASKDRVSMLIGTANAAGGDVLENFVLGCGAMLLDASRKVMSIFSDPVDIEGCLDPASAKCVKGRLRACNTIQSTIGPQSNALQLIENSREVVDIARRAGNICPKCAEVLRATQMTKLEEFWRAVPGFWNLPSWTELETMKADAIGPNIFC
ncbi:BTB domain-containing protein [Mycena chlorophos]|uniref:BTB domain-containing protein n=1 Tax=Mycena chlorophos TaxID=658473 RepID=A0A8H6SBP6_MYCCL|nr:BTB domain-containing protein [Mycena chlorophos]